MKEYIKFVVGEKIKIKEKEKKRKKSK